MAHPLVVHCKRSTFDVYIGRPFEYLQVGSVATQFRFRVEVTSADEFKEEEE